jgi:hypothetical protein
LKAYLLKTEAFQVHDKVIIPLEVEALQAEVLPLLPKQMHYRDSQALLMKVSR